MGIDNSYVSIKLTGNDYKSENEMRKCHCHLF